MGECCGYSVQSDEEYCIDGIIYGFCESEYCNGVCEAMGDCECVCHEEKERAPEVRSA